MKMFSYLLQYLAEFFVEWEMSPIQVAQKVKTHILYYIYIHMLSDDMELNVK
jgi:hypothetical protein